ncbi:MAG: hypothetical protein MUO76_11245, partial [Anaerolineaceae bacterium]|nr:hypothetical protein [Anaerolineaceae bacterium]
MTEEVPVLLSIKVGPVEGPAPANAFPNNNPALDQLFLDLTLFESALVVCKFVVGTPIFHAQRDSDENEPP